MYEGFDSFHELASETAVLQAHLSYLKSASHYLLKEATNGSLADAVDTGDGLSPEAAESTVNLLESWMMADYARQSLTPLITLHLEKLDETEQGYWESGEQNVLPFRLQNTISRFESATAAVYDLDVGLEEEYGVSLSELRAAIDPVYCDQIRQQERYNYHLAEAERSLSTAEELVQPAFTDLMTGGTDLPPAEPLGNALGHADAHLTALEQMEGPYSAAEPYRVRHQTILHALKAFSPQPIELLERNGGGSSTYDLSE